MLNKVVGLGLQDTAVSWYRLVSPLRALKREGLVKDQRMTPFSGDNQFQALRWNEDLYSMICIDDDLAQEVLRDETNLAGAVEKYRTRLEENPNLQNILWTTLVLKTEDIQRVMNLREHYKMKWILDIDDNLFDVSKDNPASDHTRRLKPLIERCISMADGLTVSVPALKRLYEPLNPNVYVNYNGLDFVKPYEGNDPTTGKGSRKSWDELKDKPRKPSKKIRIGWEGAYGHKADLDLVIPVIEELRKNYNIEFVCFGWQPPFECEWHDWVGFMKYPEKLASLNLDIAIAPLVDSGYNRCKSNLRYLEFSALGIPVVLSPTENQKGMKALEASTLYEWYEQLEKLIKDTQLRQELGAEGAKFVRENYDVHKLVHPLAEWMEKLPRRSDTAPPLEPVKKA